jgi:hypothetical protein
LPASTATTAGARPLRTTMAMEELLDGEGETLTRKAIELAKGGDIQALRLWQSGNPAGMAKGTRHRATRLAEALFDGQAEALVQKAISMALSGDQTALRLALERLCPPRRDRPVSLALPTIETAADHVSAAATIRANVAAGELTPAEGSDLVRLVEGTARAIEVHELAERIDRLEAQMASKANPTDHVGPQ